MHLQVVYVYNEIINKYKLNLYVYEDIYFMYIIITIKNIRNNLHVEATGLRSESGFSLTEKRRNKVREQLITLTHISHINKINKQQNISLKHPVDWWVDCDLNKQITKTLCRLVGRF